VPDVIGEFEDSALIKVFGGAGKGILAAPLVSEDELKQRFDLRVLGKAEQFTTSIYAISVERKIKHPGVVAICKNARQRLLA
jgi:LysR family transcriptional activator of nhaA